MHNNLRRNCYNAIFSCLNTHSYSDIFPFISLHFGHFARNTRRQEHPMHIVILNAGVIGVTSA